MPEETQTTNTQTLPSVSEKQIQVQQQIDLLDRVSDAHAEQRDQLILMRSRLEYVQRMARMFALSGCFADIKDTREDVAIAKACVKIKLGESMGFSEAESMMGIDIIQGRPAVGASLRAARMQRAGFSWPQMILTHEGCWMPLEFHGKPLLQQKVNPDGTPAVDSEGQPVLVQTVVSFTKQDAITAGLFGKDNYKKNPRNMFFARCVTNAQRWFAAACLGLDILDTYEAESLPPENGSRRVAPAREQATLSVVSFRPSEDEHRGHDESMSQKREELDHVASGEPPVLEKEKPDPEPEKPQDKQPQQTTATSVHRGPVKTFAKGEMPDAMDMRLGFECYNEGRHFRVAEDGDLQKWVDIGAAPEVAPEPAEESPDPKLAAAPRGRGGRGNKPADAFDFNK